MKRLLDPCGSLTPVWHHITNAIGLALIPLLVWEVAAIWHWPNVVGKFLCSFALYPPARFAERARNGLNLELKLRRKLFWSYFGFLAATIPLVFATDDMLRSRGFGAANFDCIFPLAAYGLTLAWVPFASWLIAGSQTAKERIA